MSQVAKEKKTEQSQRQTFDSTVICGTTMTSVFGDVYLLHQNTTEMHQKCLGNLNAFGSSSEITGSPICALRPPQLVTDTYPNRLWTDVVKGAKPKTFCPNTHRPVTTHNAFMAFQKQPTASDGSTAPDKTQARLCKRRG